MPAPVTPSALQPRYMSISQASAYSSLGQTTIRKMLRDGRLRRVTAPGVTRVLIDRLELDELLLRGEAGEAAPAAGVAAEASGVTPDAVCSTEPVSRVHQPCPTAKLLP